MEEDARLSAMWLWTLNQGVEPIDPGDDSPDETFDEEGTKPARKAPGYALEFDAARKIAQGVGAHLESLPQLVSVGGPIAYLLGVRQRAGFLFPDVSADRPSKQSAQGAQLSLFASAGDDNLSSGGRQIPKAGATVLDRLHQAMLLFGAGNSEILGEFLEPTSGVADARFWRLAQSLSALYPLASDEKRWVDGVLTRKRALGY